MNFVNLDEAEIQSISDSEEEKIDALSPEWAIKPLKQRKKISIDFYLKREAKSWANDQENLCSH